MDERFGIRGEVCVVLENVGREHTGECPWWADRRAKNCTCGVFEVQITHNIVSNSGDQYYAEAIAKGITGTPSSLTWTFDDMTVATAVATPFGSKTADCGDITTVPSGGTKDVTSGYPKVDDDDTNNPGTTGVDIVTWKATYTTSQAVGTLIGVAIHESGATLGSGSDPVLMSADISVVKGSGQALSMYVNHQVDGQ